MSKPSWGTNFILVSDVRQRLDANKIRGGPWELLAVVKRGFNEYVAIRRIHEQRVYIEEVDIKEPGLFKKIEDDELWNDLRDYLEAAGCLRVDGEWKQATGDL